MTRPQPALLPLALVVAVALAACDKTNGPKLSGSCTIGEPSALATAKAGPQDDGTTVLLNGRRIKPAGGEVELGTFPIGAALSPDGRVLAVVNNGLEDRGLPERTAASGVSEADEQWQSVHFLDTVGERVLFELPIQSSFVGLAWHPSGTTLYVAGGGRDKLRRVRWDGATAAETHTTELFGYPTGLAMHPAGTTVYATLLHRHAVVALDPQSGLEQGRWIVEAGPYQVELDTPRNRAYVSNWASDTISILDLSGTAPVATVAVGKNPTGLAVAPDGGTLYVGVADEDVVAVVDTATQNVRRFDLKLDPNDPEGISPTDVRLSADGTRLYVVAANENAVLVLDAATGDKLGAIPTAQYPTEVELSADGRRAYVVSAKGHGAGPNVDNEFVGAIIRGTAQFVDLPGADGLRAWGEDVRGYNDIMASVYSPACQDVKHPVPVQWGQKSQVIEHVVYIMRENKTYDSLLGDLGPAYGGDPELAVWGEEITPNLHALARRFGNLQNFYNESEQSVQGHIWGANGWINDFSEKTWIAFWGRPGEAQIILPGMEPASAPKRGDLFQHLGRHGVAVRNFGEYLGVVLDINNETTNITDTKFPAYFGIDDRKKVQEFVREVENEQLRPFTFLLLGNDHTRGRTPGAPTPEYMIAENDEATGLAIEALSKSPYWHKTVVFVFEDDPQGNADHVDAHRSILLVVSPWTKRGAQSKVTHSFPSLHKTMSLILGVPPMARHFDVAAAIYDVFDTAPNNAEPFEAIPSNVPFETNPRVEDLEKTDPFMAELARESLKMDFSEPDMAPGLGELLWKYRKGPDVPFPKHLADQSGEDEDDDD